MSNCASLHTVASLRADHGGPSRSITALCSSLAEALVPVSLLTIENAVGAEAPVLPWSPRVRVQFARRDDALRTMLGMSAFESALDRLLMDMGPGDVLHDHGLWLPTNHAAARAARRSSALRLVSPRGMISKWALEFHRRKKRIAWMVYQRRDLNEAAALHVTSLLEAAEARELGLKQPLVVLPNGVDVPSFADDPLSQATRYALFLSRVHPKKGVLNLVEAWNVVRPSGWKLVIAGPDDAGHRAVAERLVATSGLTDVVEFTGSLSDAEKWNWYRKSSLFVLPTFSENFGIVIAEALAAGVPVITTTGAPWEAIERERCGWWIKPTTSDLAEALRDATSRSTEELLEMGARGRSLVERDYSWQRIGEAMKQAYSWLTGSGPRPSFVLET